LLKNFYGVMFVLPDSVPTPLRGSQAYLRLEKPREQILCILTQNDTIISNLLKDKIASPDNAER
jgi:hypothetical protein